MGVDYVKKTENLWLKVRSKLVEALMKKRNTPQT